MPAHEWYEAHKSHVAAALKKGKTAPKDQAITCTLVRMKDGSHVLCAALIASKTASMVREARSAGGKVVSAGRLFLEDGKVVLEVSEGALPAKAKFTEGAAAAGVPLANAVIKPAPQAPVVAEPGAAPEDGTAALKEALSRLVPAVQQAVKDHPKRKNDLLKPVARCKEQIDNGQAAEAKASLKEIVGLLKELGPSTDGPPTGTAVPPSPPGVPAFMARAKALKAAIDGMQASDPARAAELSKLLAKAAASAKAKDFEAANAALDALEAALAGPPTGTALPPSPPGLPAFMARAKALKAAIDEVQGSDPARAAELSKLLAKAAAAAKAKDFEAANADLDAVEAALKAAPPEGQGPTTTEPRTAAAHWDAERDAAVAKLQDEIKEVRATQDPEAGEAELELKAVMRQLKAEMKTQQQAVEMERYLHEDDVVADVCELAFDLKTPLLKVLRELKLELPA